jgi:hypothetical protein
METLKKAILPLSIILIVGLFIWFVIIPFFKGLGTGLGIGGGIGAGALALGGAAALGAGAANALKGNNSTPASETEAPDQTNPWEANAGAAEETLEDYDVFIP